MKNRFRLAAVSLLWAAAPLFAGSVFVTGHDPDFHAISGNTLGAQHIIQSALTYVRDGNTAPILFLQSSLDNLPLGDHLNSEIGLINSGYTAGTTAGDHYVVVNATAFATIDLSLFSAILVPSDHGGTLTNSDLAALNARSADILTYLNAGGGLAAFAEDGFRAGGSSEPNFGFLPFLVSSAAESQTETGFTLTPAGVALGLTTADINNNFSHNIFTATGGMDVIDRDGEGRIVSLAFRGQLTPSGAVPEPETVALAAAGVLCLGLLRKSRRWSQS